MDLAPLTVVQSDSKLLNTLAMSISAGQQDRGNQPGPKLGRERAFEGVGDQATKPYNFETLIGGNVVSPVSWSN